MRKGTPLAPIHRWTRGGEPADRRRVVLERRSGRGCQSETHRDRDSRHCHFFPEFHGLLGSSTKAACLGFLSKRFSSGSFVSIYLIAAAGGGIAENDGDEEEVCSRGSYQVGRSLLRPRALALLIVFFRQYLHEC
mmetsp:Transcript_20489/g.59386  ORF Transcript_20489/g.59386 Transcript_20489/m.59386 type:complete len:135 (-) Transcript_20489:73-477(-)